jgi:hypothetical protein
VKEKAKERKTMTMRVLIASTIPTAILDIVATIRIVKEYAVWAAQPGVQLLA